MQAFLAYATFKASYVVMQSCIVSITFLRAAQEGLRVWPVLYLFIAIAGPIDGWWEAGWAALPALKPLCTARWGALGALQRACPVRLYHQAPKEWFHDYTGRPNAHYPAC